MEYKSGSTIVSIVGAWKSTQCGSLTVRDILEIEDHTTFFDDNNVNARVFENNVLKMKEKGESEL